MHIDPYIVLGSAIIGVLVGMTGAGGGAMAALADPCLCVPSRDTQNIQEAHIVLGHILCGLVERFLFPPAA
jgi:D-sedoheptulose 7-phosphate isomerase